MPKFSQEQKKAAIEHYLAHDRCIAATIRELDYPCRGTLSEWVAKAIDWLKLNYALPRRVEELAARVQMRPPTCHQNFRDLAAMSPLQYQKWIRLNEAKRLMLNEHLDASRAAFKVGYESPSQFIREYSRFFGVGPKRNIAALRLDAGDKTAPTWDSTAKCGTASAPGNAAPPGSTASAQAVFGPTGTAVRLHRPVESVA